MNGIQLLLIGIFALSIVRSVSRWRAGLLSRHELWLTVAVWLGASLVVLVPNSTHALAAALGVGRGADAVLYIAVAALCYGIWRMDGRLRESERRLTDLVRDLAIRDAMAKKAD